MKKFALPAVLLFALAGCASQQTGEIRTNADQSEAQRSANVHVQLAAGYYAHQQYSVALDEIKNALRFDTENALAYSLRGLIYMDMKESQLATDNFKRALAIAPDNPDINNNYGWFLCQNDQPALALTYFETAINNRRYQSPEKALTNAGICSLKLNNINAAQQYFLKSFQLDPDNPLTNAHIAQIYYEQGVYEKAHFYVKRVAPIKEMPANVLLLAAQIALKLQDKTEASILAAQLKKRFPNSPELATLQGSGFNE